jgi:hypothetical protein
MRFAGALAPTGSLAIVSLSPTLAVRNHVSILASDLASQRGEYLTWGSSMDGVRFAVSGG